MAGLGSEAAGIFSSSPMSLTRGAKADSRVITGRAGSE